MLLCKVVLYILLLRLWQGMASKALLISNATRNIRCGGLAELMPSKILCVRYVRRLFVEYRSLEPCCDGARVIYGV